MLGQDDVGGSEHGEVEQVLQLGGVPFSRPENEVEEVLDRRLRLDPVQYAGHFEEDLFVLAEAQQNASKHEDVEAFPLDQHSRVRPVEHQLDHPKLAQRALCVFGSEVRKEAAEEGVASRENQRLVKAGLPWTRSARCAGAAAGRASW